MSCSVHPAPKMPRRHKPDRQPHTLGCEAGDLAYADGAFSARDEQNMTWADIARRSNKAGGHSVLGEFTPPDVTYPNGCHICEVEIDPTTGKVAFCDYVVVEDVGTVLSPDLVEGQMHGGVAHGQHRHAFALQQDRG